MASEAPGPPFSDDISLYAVQRNQFPRRAEMFSVQTIGLPEARLSQSRFLGGTGLLSFWVKTSQSGAAFVDLSLHPAYPNHLDLPASHFTQSCRLGRTGVCPAARDLSAGGKL